MAAWNSREIDTHKIDAVVIGGSAGGIKALMNILPALPETFRLPIIIVLHMPDMFESKLAEIFQHHVKVVVSQAQDKEYIKASHVYFAPPGYHLSIEPDKSFSLSCEEPMHFSRPSIDILMNSAADAYGKSVAGFLLTGASADGADGLSSIKKAGGLTVVHDPQEAEMPLMPQAALNVEQPDFILRLAEMRSLLIFLESN